MIAGITKPLRAIRLRACLITGRLKFASREILTLDGKSEPTDESGNTWDVSLSVRYLKAQLDLLKVS